MIANNILTVYLIEHLHCFSEMEMNIIFKWYRFQLYVIDTVKTLFKFTKQTNNWATKYARKITYCDYKTRNNYV